MMKIAVYGYGFVGHAYGTYLSQYHDIFPVDPAKGLTLPDTKLDGVIIAVPAPTVDGKVDTSIIDDILAQYNIPVMIKSTIPPDYATTLPDNVTYSPEFLRADSADQDVVDATHIILGGGQFDFWAMVFSGLVKYVTDAKTASYTKYAINTFLATKVTFMNELADLYDGDWDKLKKLITLDPRIGDSHMDVPGPDGIRGWGGYCFPKDVDSFLNFSDNTLSVLNAANQANKRHRNESSNS